jgi:anti-sigma factor ChrR (cupin superfamily)
VTRKTLEELATGYALGALDPREEAQLEALIAHDADVRQEVAAFIDTAADFAAASSPRVQPSVEQRIRILATIAAAPQLHRQTAETPVSNGYSFLPNSPDGWINTDHPGVRTKLLSSGPHPGYEVMLVELAPGAKVPEHVHSGIEEIYMLSGHLYTEGQMMGPGDFARADAGTHHREVVSADGCLALLILCPPLAA